MAVQSGLSTELLVHTHFHISNHRAMIQAFSDLKIQTISLEINKDT